MNVPRISVCLPNLNNRPFLEERLASVFDQTFTDWELVIYDNHSDDGAWELFQQAARNDSRIRIAQAERKGMYANWNNCVAAARGDYVYIATSDDNMAPDCLEKLAEALDQNPQCDVAHCKLRMFDAEGNEMSSEWWDHCSLFARSSGDLLWCSHVRLAPFDGMLHLLGDTVYISITQLLIRRSLFEKIGMFENRWGSLGDFNWNMRAGLVANTVHVPDTWGGWRQHAGQATAAARFGSAQHAGFIEEMIEHAISRVAPLIEPRVRIGLTGKWGRFMRDMRQLDLAMRTLPIRSQRNRFLMRKLLTGSAAAWWELNRRLTGRSDFIRSQPDIVAGWLEREGVAPRLIPLKPAEVCAQCPA
jgi:hypothetical protein